MEDIVLVWGHFFESTMLSVSLWHRMVAVAMHRSRNSRAGIN